MNPGLVFFYIVSFLGLMIHGFLHGQKKPKESCYYNLPSDIGKTIIELLVLWWILEWRIW